MFFCDNIQCGWCGEENKLLKLKNRRFKKTLCPGCFEESIYESWMVIDVKAKPTE